MNEPPDQQRLWHWRNGAMKLALGGLLCAAVFIFSLPARLDGWWKTNVPPDFPWQRSGYTLMLAVLALPLVLAGVGLMELLMRRPYRDLAARWDALPEWVQGLLVLVLTVGSFALLMWYGNQFLAPL